MKNTVSSKTKQHIPRTLAPAFPEYRASDLNLRVDAALIIERTLEQGTRRELQWLFQNYSEERIRKFITESGARRLSKRAFNYWRLVLGVQVYHHPPFRDLRDLLWRR